MSHTVCTIVKFKHTVHFVYRQYGILSWHFGWYFRYHMGFWWTTWGYVLGVNCMGICSDLWTLTFDPKICVIRVGLKIGSREFMGRIWDFNSISFDGHRSFWQVLKRIQFSVIRKCLYKVSSRVESVFPLDYYWNSLIRRLSEDKKGLKGPLHFIFIKCLVWRWRK